MLGRTANDLFWLSRYLERAETMARLVEVGYRIAMLPRDGERAHAEWRSTLESAGCALSYDARYGSLNARDVINYLLFDTENASSVRSCLAVARRNGRAQRTALTSEMWTSLNSLWMEYEAIKPRELSSEKLADFLEWIKQGTAGYRGALMNTILRNDTFHFSQLGVFIERADNTARILDVKYYVLLPRPEMIGTGVDNMQWAAILRSVSAHRSYRWVYRDTYRPWNIADYLILNPLMPRSLRFCYGDIAETLLDLEEAYGEKNLGRAASTAAETLALLAPGTMTTIFQGGLHEFIQHFIGRNNRLATEISETYHFDD